MDLSPTRALALDIINDALGTAMTATVPGGQPVPTRVEWVTPEPDDVGRSRQLQHAFWVPTADLATVPRGTEFVGPEPQGGADKTWRADQEIDRKHGKRLIAVTEVLE